MRILYITCELNPLVKVGGLADVSAALPAALQHEGVDVRVLMPGLPGVVEGLNSRRRLDETESPFGSVQLVRGRLPSNEVPVYVLDAPRMYERPGNPYVDGEGADWPDNHLRFALLGWVAAHFADPRDGWQPDLIHCNDWHAALAPAYVKAEGRSAPASVLTIHNLAYQGLFPKEAFPDLALPDPFFAVDGVEFYDQVSFMKAGIFFADKVTTVSPQYACEIQTAESGCGLDRLLRLRQPVGILNGVDYRVWNPETDPALAVNYGAATLEHKAQAKRALQQELGLELKPERPLFIAVSRLSWQKGLDLIFDVLPELISARAQFALLGTGERALEERFAGIAAGFPGIVSFVAGYDERLAHRMIAGADVITLPSRFEPCGLTQLYGLRYGTLPLVRRVGGLADSVADATPAALRDDSATGFVFDEASGAAFLQCALRAIECFREPETWSRMQRRAMAQDFSWAASARRYLAVYRSTKETANHGRRR
jgi:starch synthase